MVTTSCIQIYSYNLEYIYYYILLYYILYYIILYYTILYHIILYYTILYHIILYYIIFYYILYYYIILYYIILYIIILYYIILYYIISYYIILYLYGRLNTPTLKVACLTFFPVWFGAGLRLGKDVAQELRTVLESFSIFQQYIYIYI